MAFKESANELVNKYLKALDTPLSDLFMEVREVVLKTDPSLEEDIKWKNCLTYIQNKKNIIQTVLGKEKITLIFHDGMQIEDKYNLLEGDGAKTKSYRIVGKVNKTALSSYVKQASALHKK